MEPGLYYVEEKVEGDKIERDTECFPMEVQLMVANADEYEVYSHNGRPQTRNRVRRRDARAPLSSRYTTHPLLKIGVVPYRMTPGVVDRVEKQRPTMDQETSETQPRAA